MNINGNEPSFYPCNVKINKCINNCSSINDPYSKLCVFDVVKKIDVDVFNLVLKTNATKQ